MPSSARQIGVLRTSSPTRMHRFPSRARQRFGWTYRPQHGHQAQKPSLRGLCRPHDHQTIFVPQTDALLVPRFREGCHQAGFIDLGESRRMDMSLSAQAVSYHYLIDARFVRVMHACAIHAEHRSFVQPTPKLCCSQSCLPSVLLQSQPRLTQPDVHRMQSLDTIQLLATLASTVRNTEAVTPMISRCSRREATQHDQV